MSTEAIKQEPVAWRYNGNLHEFDPSDWAEGPVTPLYTAPPQPKSLTDREIGEVLAAVLMQHSANLFYPFARAIEQKLREKNT